MKKNTSGTCQTCGEIVSAWNPRKKYCSWTCAGKSMRKRIYTCTICLKVFEPEKRNTYIYTCSPECRKVLNVINWEKVRIAKKKKKPKLKSKCPICKKSFNTYSDRYRKRIVCSRPCRAKYSWHMTQRKERESQQPRDPLTNKYIKKATPSTE